MKGIYRYHYNGKWMVTFKVFTSLTKVLQTKLIKQWVMPLSGIVLLAVSSSVNAETVKIGLRAHHGIEKSMSQWKPTADFLSKQIPEHKFVMIPFIGINELMQEAAKNKFDFILTNPSSYVELEFSLGASAILTLRNKRQGRPYTKFGSVIFTRKDNKNINEINDLRGKTIVAVSKPAFGGWRVAKRELIKAGFTAKELENQVRFSGGIQQDVVSIIALGNTDVGIVRTDMLERMAASGLIKLEDFKIINKKSTKDFPFARSTQLYPEWPFAKTNKTSSALSKKVALALLTMPAEEPAAIAGKYVGWTVPEDYQPVHNLMKDLKIGSYKHYHENEVEHFFEKYLVHFIFSMIVAFIFISITLYVLTTNRKLIAAKKQQNKLMDELEMRVAERAKDYLVAKEVAEKANKAKTEFLSSMSHELRTPMNAVLGFAQLIEYDADEKQLTEIKENANEILHAGRHLLGLINDVLDLSKIEEGKLQLDIKPVSVNGLISDVVRLLEAQAKEKLVTITYESSPDELEVLVDQRSLKQIMINLITNAIKYNSENGSVDISVSKEKNASCRITVADSGDGIAEDELSIIFEPFKRVTYRTSTEGSGVGLAITKNLVEIMKGEIKVESKLGEGSTFSVLFKLAE